MILKTQEFKILLWYLVGMVCLKDKKSKTIQVQIKDKEVFMNSEVLLIGITRNWHLDNSKITGEIKRYARSEGLTMYQVVGKLCKRKGTRT